MTQLLGPYPEGEFDIDVFKMMILKQTKMTKVCPQLYRFLSNRSRLDFMLKENPWYEFNYRVVRFKITDDIYETVITNLDRGEFSMNDIKNLYNKL